MRAQGQVNGAALVIGNSKYQWEASLPNVRRDTPDIAKCFQAMGLKTEVIQDADRAAMLRAIEKFKAAARGANLAAFYFAGHGTSWAKESYVVPADADLSTPGAVPTLVPVPAINTAMEGAAHRLLVFDSCRNNPADGWRQVETEREAFFTLGADAGVAANTLTLFSTAPGRVALDGPAGENSPFAAALLRQLEAPSVDFQALPTRLRRDLLISTKGRQVLWDQSSYQQAFVIKGAAGSGGGKANGWNLDPSRIMELPKAYAFVRENGMFLPEGLIAHRPLNAPPGLAKVGSYHYIAENAAQAREPQVLIVMSVEEYPRAELVMSGKSKRHGIYWRFTSGTLDGDRLQFTPAEKFTPMTLDWKDANSGNLTQMFGRQGRLTYDTRFTRLDG